MSRLYGPTHRSLQDRFDTRRLADNVETRVVLTDLRRDVGTWHFCNIAWQRLARLRSHGGSSLARIFRQWLATRSQRDRTTDQDGQLYARRVAARLGEARDETKLDGVLANTKNDWDSRRRGLRRKCSGCAARCGDHRHLTTKQVGHQIWHQIVSTLRPTVTNSVRPAYRNGEMRWACFQEDPLAI